MPKIGGELHLTPEAFSSKGRAKIYAKQKLKGAKISFGSKLPGAKKVKNFIRNSQVISGIRDTKAHDSLKNKVIEGGLGVAIGTVQDIAAGSKLFRAQDEEK